MLTATFLALLPLACPQTAEAWSEDALYLVEELERMHPEVSRRVVGTRVLKGRPSEERLLAHARDFYTDAGLG